MLHSMINILYKIRRYFYFFLLFLSASFQLIIFSWSRCRSICFKLPFLFLSILLHGNSGKHFHFIGLEIAYHVLKVLISFYLIFICGFWSRFCAWAWSLVIWLSPFWSTRSLVMSSITTFRCALSIPIFIQKAWTLITTLLIGYLQFHLIRLQVFGMIWHRRTAIISR